MSPLGAAANSPQRLAQAEPSNAQYQQDLSIPYNNNLGDNRAASGRT